jgi:large subunit ribosomal protein L10
MPKPEKVAQVEELKERFIRARGVVLMDYLGLSAQEYSALRRFLREQGVEFQVVKNTLARRAAQAAGAEFLVDYFTGPNAIVVGYDDPAAAFRASRECAKRFKVRVKAGLFDRALVSPAEVEWYANLPSRDELVGRLAMAMASPMRGLAVALAGVIRKLAVVLAEVQKKKTEV